MILVTGATGHVGGALVAALAPHHRVRAMTRRPDSAVFPAGVEVRYGHAAEPDSLSAAFEGVERAFLMSAQPPGTAGSPTHHQALVDAARRAGVRHVALLSVYRSDTDDALGAWHRAAEATVTDSGLSWTLLRPGRFMSNALQWRPMLARGDTVSVPFANRPAASIDPADIAAVAALALTTDGHAGAAYQMSGPATLTPIEEVAVLGAAIGRELRAVEPPPERLRAGLARGGMPPAMIDAVLARTARGVEGTEVLSTVSDLLGRPPVAFAEWVDRNIHLFT